MTARSSKPCGKSLTISSCSAGVQVGRQRVGRAAAHRHLHQVDAPGEPGEDRRHPRGARRRAARRARRTSTSGASGAARRARRVDDVHGELARRVDREQPGGVRDGRVHGQAAQLGRCPGERRPRRPVRPLSIHSPRSSGSRTSMRDAQVRALGQMEVAQAQGHRQLHRARGSRARRGCPSGRTRRGSAGSTTSASAVSWARSRSRTARAWSTSSCVLGPGRLAGGVARRRRSGCAGRTGTWSSSWSIRDSAKSTALR